MGRTGGEAGFDVDGKSIVFGRLATISDTPLILGIAAECDRLSRFIFVILLPEEDSQ